MSNRSLLELNHDAYPHTEAAQMVWLRDVLDYIRSGDPSKLPHGVTWFGTRHHSDPCLAGKPPRGWNNRAPLSPEKP
jgi:hypothetical protein